MMIALQSLEAGPALLFFVGAGRPLTWHQSSRNGLAELNLLPDHGGIQNTLGARIAVDQPDRTRASKGFAGSTFRFGEEAACRFSAAFTDRFDQGVHPGSADP